MEIRREIRKEIGWDKIKGRIERGARKIRNAERNKKAKRQRRAG